MANKDKENDGKQAGKSGDDEWNQPTTGPNARSGGIVEPDVMAEDAERREKEQEDLIKRGEKESKGSNM